jgi:hypothetical protein
LQANRFVAFRFEILIESVYVGDRPRPALGEGC